MKNTVYITSAKFNNIIRGVDTYNSVINTADLYHTDLTKILSLPEIKSLTVYKHIIENPEKLNDYKKRNNTDSKQWVFESTHSSYHKKSDCERLQSSFENIAIPEEIKHQGDESIAKFREFFESNGNLYSRDSTAFMGRVKIAFNLANEPLKVDFNNSGVEEIANCSWRDIENKITRLLKVMDDFKEESEVHKKEINNFGYATHKAKEKLSDGKSVKKIDIDGSVISQWHNYKAELKQLLKECFHLKSNPDFEFDQNILEQLGFVPCHHCNH